MVRIPDDFTSRVPAPGPISGRIESAGTVGRGVARIGQQVAEIAADRRVQLIEAEDRLNKRRESVERIRSARELLEIGNGLFTEFESSRDFSRREDVEEFGAKVEETANKIVSQYQGSEEGRLRLEEKLEPVKRALSDKAAVASVDAQDALVNREFDEITNDLAARVRLGEDPVLLIAGGMDFLESEKDALRPGQEIAFIRNLNARVWGAKVNDFMAKGDFDAAEDLLGVPEIRAAIGDKGQRQAFDRIAAARRQGRSRILTPPQMAAMGFPSETIDAGLVVQQKSDGSVNVVFRPPKDVDEETREKRIKAIESQLLKSGASPEEAGNRAINIVDGNIRIEIVPGLGVAREINDITGEVREVPLGGEATAEPQRQRTLFDLAQSGSIAGIVPAAQEFLGGTVGQIPGVPVAEDVIQARQEMREAQNGLIRALSINPRFPVGEIDRIRREIQIEPKILDSQRALISRMRGVREALGVRLENEQAAAANPNLPLDTRSAASQAAKDIGNFLNRLGDPPGEDDLPPEGVPDFSARIGTTRDGKDVWESPDGKRWVVE